MNDDQPGTDAEHETFLRRRGWTPDLREPKKTQIEQQWANPQDREMADALGF